MLEAELAKAYAQGYVGKNIMGSRLRLRHRHSPRRRRVRGGRRDGAHRVARRQARAAAHQAAVPGGRRASTTARPRSTTSRRSATCRAIMTNGAEWFAQLGPEKNGGPKLFCVSGHVKKPGVYEASMNDDAARADFRLRRRHPRRPPAEGGHPRRIVGADPAARPARHPGQLRRRGRRRDRCSGRPASSSWTRPRAWSGSARNLLLLLQARVVRQVHAVPRRRRLAAQDPDPDRARRRGDARHRPARQRRRTTSPARRCARSATPRRRRR